uniref:Beclin 1-associated autophagy-related key regulator n=1 Tax=Timema tahoe TaxID=61484 RepID=A0A7R9FG28_9NEOP|nr:unnamed protein product [Timema tahoe]
MPVKNRKQEKGETEKANLTKTNRERSVRLPRYEEKVGKMEHYVRQWQHNVKKQQCALEAVHQDLKEVIRSSVQQLVTYIFPITAVQPAPPGTGKEEEDTVTALADASRTAYVRGHWILTDSSGELHHCIVAPTLPGSGDYSAYSAWVATNKETGQYCSSFSPPSTYLPPRLTLPGLPHVPLRLTLPGHPSVSPGLTLPGQSPYLPLQLTLLGPAHYRPTSGLPHVPGGGTDSVDHNPAYNLAAALTYTTQLINVLAYYLDVRQGPLEVDPVQARSLENQLTHDLDLNEGSGSEDESDNLPWEWETVPNISCPETAAGPAVLPSQQLMNTQQATSMAGGLVTSAAASIVSIWRGWTGNK